MYICLCVADWQLFNLYGAHAATSCPLPRKRRRKKTTKTNMNSGFVELYFALIVICCC